MTLKPEKLATILDSSFDNIALLKEALTHRSAASTNNERLEFLGDAILGFAVAARLYNVKSSASEGEMSRLRAALVRKETLAGIAREWSIGDYLHLGSGELKSGGHRRASILADTVEAIIGAVYTDRGIEAATALINKLYGVRLETIDEQKATKDPKSELQEFLQSRGLPLPGYKVISSDGPPHARVFVVQCEVPAFEVIGDGQGVSVRDAEQAAAKAALEVILHE